MEKTKKIIIDLAQFEGRTLSDVKGHFEEIMFGIECEFKRYHPQNLERTEKEKLSNTINLVVNSGYADHRIQKISYSGKHSSN
ncbi:MAG: hypothetical protein AAGA43_13390 [Bacteroidota bacterium]